jgi:hypothetical protein
MSHPITSNQMVKQNGYRLPLVHQGAAPMVVTIQVECLTTLDESRCDRCSRFREQSLNDNVVTSGPFRN